MSVRVRRDRAGLIDAKPLTALNRASRSELLLGAGPWPVPIVRHKGDGLCQQRYVGSSLSI